MELQPHQQRVVDEKTELDDKRTKLKAFIDGIAIFAGLPDDEKERLVCAGLFAERHSASAAGRLTQPARHLPP